MLSAAEIAAMRATQEEALPDTCVISRPTWTTTDQGGRKEGTPSTVATEACRVMVASRQAERVQGGRYGDLPQYVFTLAHDTAAQSGDYLAYDSESYQVIGRLEDGAWETATRLVAVRV